MEVLLLFEPLNHSRPGPDHEEVFLLLADGSIHKGTRGQATDGKPWTFSQGGLAPREVYPIAWAPVPYVAQVDIQKMFISRKTK